MIKTKWTSIPVVRLVKILRLLEAMNEEVKVKKPDVVYECGVLRKMLEMGADE